MRYRPRIMKRAAIAVAFSLAVVMPTMTVAAEDGPIRIGYIDPLSGPFANAGEIGLLHFEYLAERINETGGVLGRDIEIVPFDNKGNAQESLQILQEVADSGIQYITQGNGSYVAGALVSGVTKHNTRNPDNRIVYLNYAAVAPELTNEKCSFWHFRFDANSAMKLEAITNYIAEQDDIESVFLINQDYSHGHAISRIGESMLAEKRPDIEIVGDILHPVGRVKDFSPYISEIRASGADAIITGNWGVDLSLLVKSGAQAGLDAQWYTYYGGGLGTPTALGEAAVGNVFMVTEWQENLAVRFEAPELVEILEEFEGRHAPFEFYYLRAKTQMEMLQKAMEKAGTSDPLAVAYALEGMSVETALGTATMRAEDHQVLQPLYISVFTEDYLEYDSEGTGIGWSMVYEIPAEETALPTSCEIERPPRP